MPLQGLSKHLNKRGGTAAAGRAARLKIKNRQEELLMVRKLPFLVGLIFLVSLSARAQDKVEVFGGYSYERFNNSPNVNFNRGGLSGQYQEKRWLGGGADFDGQYAS